MSKFNFKNLISRKYLLKILLVGFIFSLMTAYYLQNQLMNIYNRQNSLIIKDRNGEIILIKQNEKGYWSDYLDKTPSRFKEFLIKKEDKYFYFHFGFNPWSTFQAALGYFGLGERKASSTITQQLVKILLQKESERNLKNKLIESFYTLSLEMYQSKETILKMYLNSVYFGNQSQGLSEASRLYFGVSPDLLTDGQILQLLATISGPSENNPAENRNKEIALTLAQRLGLDSETTAALYITNPLEIKENIRKYSHSSDSYFELRDLPPTFLKSGGFTPTFLKSGGLINGSSQNLQVTLDKELTEKIRKIVKRNIENLKLKRAQNGAAIVIKLPENELLALIGSPDPKSFETGYKINMLKEARPIGSTIKPFIYLKSFEKGLRPYSLVDDREYKYITAIGFPLYPKNFDYKYRGQVTLHYALSNSLNVPAVKVLEYVGLEDFYKFLEEDLEFKPVQSLANYQLGISLGVLEMSLLDLAQYFTIFPNKGILKELKIYPVKSAEGGISPKAELFNWVNKNNRNSFLEKEISKPEYIQLINKILNDRKTGIEQFGLESEFNLFQSNYALKTGTSRNFRDSWVIGYTPDFLVGVWVGNSDNTPMDEVSGQLGAGRIWAETMELLFNSKYNKKTLFEFNLLKEFYEGANIQYGLPNDDYEASLNALKEKDLALILNPHQGDVFFLEDETKIILKAKENVRWFIDNEFLGEGQTNIFLPRKESQYQIKAVNANGLQEIITIWVWTNQ